MVIDSSVIPDGKLVDRIIGEIIGGKDPSNVSIREILMLSDKIGENLSSSGCSADLSQLNMGVPGLPTPPLILKAQKDAIDNGFTSSYPPFDGVQALKSASSGYVRDYFGVEIPADCHIPSTGAM